ncbi:uncharacterized protein LOC133791532 [Humulus lupulus]|uniref:uncharacterized protein LOC133791532 n=1 Tax=Humulus lupulus TaxID=3486 RepID=UPI002B401B45|nr:uncharacterized protein LOC133791532 [Humulus lupulus]
MRESTAGSATTEEEPEQQPPVSPPRRRPTEVMIREPAGTPPAKRPSVPLGKGKKKATKPVEHLDDSSDENDMDSVNVFDIYSTPETPAAPPSKKKASKRHHGESSKAPQAKKPRNAGLPEDGSSANATPPSPRNHQIPPAPTRSTPSPAAPTDQTQQASLASTGGDITSRAFKSVKDRVAKIAMLTLTTGRLRSGVVTEQDKSLEQRHADELKAAAENYAEQLAVVLEEKNKLVEELKEKQKSLDKTID